MDLATRRRLLVQAAALATTACASSGESGWLRTRLTQNPFQLGVASGDPWPDSVVIWTRLAPDPLQLAGGMSSEPVPVRWEVAEDWRFERMVRRGGTIAEARRAHAVHVEVSGLRPGREYWYRFLAGGHRSQTGRTVTAPAPGAPVEHLRAAFASCQKYEAGFYSAHRHIARLQPDLVLFLGDYIYEKARSFSGVRDHPLFEAVDLEGYRLRYATYRSDPDLQASHAAAPWAVIWDDHEVSNDYSGDRSRQTPHREAFLRRRAAAYQAYFEHMPLRRACRPAGARMGLYRSLAWGRLAEFQLLDTRQYRPTPACEQSAEKRQIRADCAERFDPARSLLGPRQEAWLYDRFRRSEARWNVLVQPYVLNTIAEPSGSVSNDGWDGYAANRERLLQAWRDSRAANPIAIGGDIHSFVAADLALRPGERPIASEFVGGSISSEARPDALPPAAFRANPELKFGHKDHRGFGLMHLTPGACTVTFHAVENAYLKRSPVRVLKRFDVAAGRSGLVMS